MITETYRSPWNRIQVKVKQTDLEISATISSQHTAHNVANEIQQAISNLLRMHQARSVRGEMRSNPFERIIRKNEQLRYPMGSREKLI